MAALLVVTFHVRQSMQIAVWRPLVQGVHPGDDYPYQTVGWFESFMTNIDYAVDFFFVAGGFLLALPYMQALVRGRPLPSARSFAIGRLTRAIPLYWLLVLLLWTSRNYDWAHAQWLDLFEHLTFTQWLDSKRIFYTIGPAWSLADEIWMYPLIPLVPLAVVGICRRLSSPAARAAVVAMPLAAIVAASVAFKWWTTSVLHVPGNHFAWYFGMPAKVDTFVLGMVLALVVALAADRRLPRGGAPTVRLLAAGAIGVLSIERWHAITHHVLAPWTAYVHTIAAAAFVIYLLGTTLGRPGVLTRLTDSSLIVTGGALTYAIYIGHESVVDFLVNSGVLRLHPQVELWFNLAVALPAAVVWAVVLREAIEKPSAKLRSAFDRNGRPTEYYPDLLPTGM